MKSKMPVVLLVYALCDHEANTLGNERSQWLQIGALMALTHW